MLLTTRSVVALLPLSSRITREPFIAGPHREFATYVPIA